MTIQNFIYNQIDRGFTLRRLSKLLGVSPAALSYHLNGKTKQVSLQLAKSIYEKFDFILDGFHEYEFGDTYLHNTLNTMDIKIEALTSDIEVYKDELTIARGKIQSLNDEVDEAYRIISNLKEELE